MCDYISLPPTSGSTPVSVRREEFRALLMTTQMALFDVWAFDFFFFLRTNYSKIAYFYVLGVFLICEP